MPVSLPKELIDHDGTDVWGVSPSALALAANARKTGRWDALERHYDIQVIVTNYEPGWKSYRDGLEALCDTWLEPPLDTAVALVEPETASTFFAGAAYFDTPSEVASVLVNGQDVVASTDEGEPAIMPRRDFIGYAESETARRLLQSLDVVHPVSGGFRLNEVVFERLGIGFEKSRSAAAVTLVTRVLEALGVEETAVLMPSILPTLNIEPPDDPVPATGAIPVLIRHHSLVDLVDELFGNSLAEAIEDLRADQRSELARLDEARRFGHPSEEAAEPIEWPLEPPEAGVCAMASRRGIPVAASWLSDRLDTEPLAVLDRLTDGCVDVRYRDGLLHFDTAYRSPTDDVAALDSYTEWLTARSETLRKRIEALAQVATGVEELWDGQRASMLEDAIDVLSGWTASPTRFVYTVFDTEYHADEYDIDQYVGPSDELQAEVEEIRRWRRNRRHDAESFAELVPEVVSHPLEHDSADEIVRIMCPWTNFAIQDYTALFNRLLDNDVTVRILMRLPTSREWNQLKSNLLSRLGDTSGNLELRSYTRYREFRDHTQLRELDSESEQRQRTGIHAKLFIAGGPEDGNVLAGSANLMENSFFYNPEAGIQTRNPNLIAAAIDYFDLVWRLASPDRITEDTFTGETEYRFFPRVYRP